MSAVWGHLIPSGCFEANVAGVLAHGFVLGAEHRHGHRGHQNRTLAVVQLGRTTGEQSAAEEEEEEERMRERSSTARRV